MKLIEKMITASELKKLSKREKFRLMDLIWQDLSTDENQIEVLDSHKKRLDERADLVQQGTAKFVDWEQAKKEIERATQ